MGKSSVSSCQELTGRNEWGGDLKPTSLSMCHTRSIWAQEQSFQAGTYGTSVCAMEITLHTLRTGMFTHILSGQTCSHPHPQEQQKSNNNKTSLKVTLSCWRDGSMVQNNSCLPVDLSSDPSTHLRELRTTCNSSSWGSNTLSCLLRAPAHMYTDTIIIVSVKYNIRAYCQAQASE